MKIVQCGVLPPSSLVHIVIVITKWFPSQNTVLSPWLDGSCILRVRMGRFMLQCCSVQALQKGEKWCVRSGWLQPAVNILTVLWLWYESTNRNFQHQPGEGPNRGLLHDYETSNFAKARFQLYSCYQWAGHSGCHSKEEDTFKYKINLIMKNSTRSF